MNSKPREQHGYGNKKFWHWEMRSDLPTATQSVTPDTIYITPFTMDSICDFSVLGIFGKWSYQTVEIASYSWTITWYIGVYKRMRGRSGTAGTLELIGMTSANWIGSGATGPTIIYDFSGATSSTVVGIRGIIDGQLYLAQAWKVEETGIGITTINKYGNSVSSGTWMYENSGASTTPLPQTISALAGTAKTEQEHWIGIR